VVKYLIIANVIVFLLQIFITRKALPPLPDDLEDEIAARQPDATEADREKQQEALRKARRELERMLDQYPRARTPVRQEWVQLDPKKIKPGQVWPFLPCRFCHAFESRWHVLCKTLRPYWSGRLRDTMHASRQSLPFFLTAASCGSLASLAPAWYAAASAPAI